MEARVSPWIWLSLPAGLLLLCAWVRWERRYKGRGCPWWTWNCSAPRASAPGAC
ncbi:hypothetical protein QJS66_08775 [Kocuria rhizophila]|nr:hypothetical protein QJS66_08775 [Kocuria rhizophila]